MASSTGSVMRASSSPSDYTVIEGNGLGSPSCTRSGTASGRKRKASEVSGPIINTTKPERRKITRACDSCKGKKTRCTGTLPCLRCTRLSLPCEYTAAYSRGLPPSPPPAPELMLRYATHSRSSPAYTERVAWTPENSVSHASSCSSMHSLKSERRSQSRSVVAPPPVLSPRSSPEPGATDLEGNYLGPTSGISFLNRVWRRLRLRQDDVSTIPSPSCLPQEEACKNKSSGSSSSSVFRFGDRPLSEDYTETGFTLPPLEKALQLVGIYFDFSIVTYRFLHRGAVESWVREMYEKNISPANPPTGNLVARAAIVFMVFAVATMHGERRPGDSDSEECNESERWYIASKYMSSIETGRPKLETIQARLGQCLYLLSSSRANECWYAFGTASQLVTALGLHRRRPATATTLPKARSAYLEHELRKRVFWSVYTIDKYLSVMFGRPRLLHDEDIDQELPDVVDDEDMDPERDPEHPQQKQETESADCLMIAVNLHFRLARILGEISRQVYTIKPCSKSAPLEAALHLTSELEKWKESVPPLFSRVRASSLIPPLCRQSHVLQLAYSHAMIHATRSFLLNDFTSDLSRGRSSVMKDKIKTHVQKCISAAKDVMTLVVSLADQGILVQSFWLTHYVCFCAIIVAYIYTIQQYRHCPLPESSALGGSVGKDDEARSLFSLAESCQQHLAQATRRNCPSRRYSIILEELRLEVHRQIAAYTLRTSTSGVVGGMSENDSISRDAQKTVPIALSEQQRQKPHTRTPTAADTEYSVPLESYNPPNPNPNAPLIPGELQAPHLEVNNHDDACPDLGLLSENCWEGGSTWWTQLDSWAFSSIGSGNDSSMFTF